MGVGRMQPAVWTDVLLKTNIFCRLDALSGRRLLFLIELKHFKSELK